MITVKAFSALGLNLLDIQRARLTSFDLVESHLDFFPEALHLQGALFIPFFQQSQALAYHFAGGVVTAGSNFFADELLKLRGQ